LHELYRRWLDELWAGVPGAAESLAAPGFVGHWPAGQVHGPQGLAEVVAQTRAMFSEITFRLQVGPVAEGDFVAARWAGTGTTATGSVEFLGNDLLRVVDNQVVEYWPASPPPVSAPPERSSPADP
jgi:predicted SnoaL-like aldol condensation-catalyzing enzyme